jgi:hypothetical protein
VKIPRAVNRTHPTNADNFLDQIPVGQGRFSLKLPARFVDIAVILWF